MHGFDKLELSTETLRELTPDELTGVAGGARPPEPTPPVFAVTHTGICESLLSPCIPPTEVCA